MQRPQHHLNTVHGSFSTDCRNPKKSVARAYEYVNIKRKHTDTMATALRAAQAMASYRKDAHDHYNSVWHCPRRRVGNGL